MQELCRAVLPLAALSALVPPPLWAGPLVLRLTVSPAEVEECGGGEVQVGFAIQNPERAEVAGLQAFLRFPAELFQPVAYRKLELKGFAAFNGPPPFGSGFSGCDLRPPDPWDDGRGTDRVVVLAMAYAEDGSGRPTRAAEATLGAFVFRLRPGAAIPEGPALFSLELDSCQSALQQGIALYDSAGRALEVAFQPAEASVQVSAGIRVRELACAPGAPGAGVVLSWAPPTTGPFDGVNVYRGGVLIRALVPPAVRTITDLDAPREKLAYQVAVISAGREEVCRQGCEVDLRGAGEPFTRGDANGDGRRNISDPVALLGYLFLSGALACPDGADFDDDGQVTIADAVAILDFLFQKGAPPPPPYPGVGDDPTADSLGCPGA